MALFSTIDGGNRLFDNSAPTRFRLERRSSSITPTRETDVDSRPYCNGKSGIKSCMRQSEVFGVLLRGCSWRESFLRKARYRDCVVTINLTSFSLSCNRQRNFA